MGKIIVCLSIFLLLVGCSTTPRTVQVKDELFRVAANPEKKFYFPYYVYIPRSYIINSEKKVPLLVIPNNTGTSIDDFSVHEQRVIQDMGRGSMDLAEKAGLPVLMPVFPRPRKQWQIYTQSLDRDTMLVKDGPLKRIDLQLIAMVEDAKNILNKKGIKTLDKFLLNGFSANGTFTNRFPFLHPQRVLGVASGGVNGIPTLPITKLKNKPLPFPIGISDIQNFTGKPFDIDSYKKIPQFIYMGAKDDNDTVPFRDAFSEDEAALINKVLPKKMMPDRWNKCIAVYKSNNINAKFKTYKQYGHKYTSEIRQEIADFFGELY